MLQKTFQIMVVSVLLVFTAHSGGCAISDTENDGRGTKLDKGEDTQTTGEVDTDTGSPSDDDDSDTDSETDTELEVDTTHGEIVASHIWIANSSEGSVSKIDTREMLELGRYWVRPDRDGSPSRTSVNLDGDVAVAARGGGITKFFADTKKCRDNNGQPGIQTSSGASDILDWEDEECRAWHTPFSYTSMRALAWTSDGKLWASGSTGFDESSVMEVVLLNGETGAVEKTVILDTGDVTAGSHGHGGYGGVVDGENNFWMVQIYSQKLIKVSYSDFSYEVFEEPTGVYGVSLDENGRIWTCNTHVAYFDPASRSWSSPVLVSSDAPFHGLAGGCMADGNGLLWVSVFDKLYAVDINDFAIVDTITNLPSPTDTITGEDSFWGVAVDVDGYVWTIPRYGNVAYKVDPDTHSYETVHGLVGAYTYSDMTGFLLQISRNPV